MQGLEKIVKEHSFFQGMSPGHIDFVSGCARNARFRKGAFLFREGEDANAFYCIRTGRVALELHVPGRGAVQIDDRKAGDVLGWSWLVEPYRWYSDARAVEEVRALVFDCTCLRNKWQDDPELGYQMYQRFAPLMHRSLQATRLQLVDMYGAD